MGHLFPGWPLICYLWRATPLTGEPLTQLSGGKPGCLVTRGRTLPHGYLVPVLCLFPLSLSWSPVLSTMGFCVQLGTPGLEHTLPPCSAKLPLPCPPPALDTKLRYNYIVSVSVYSHAVISIWILEHSITTSRERHICCHPSSPPILLPAHTYHKPTSCFYGCTSPGHSSNH